MHDEIFKILVDTSVFSNADLAHWTRTIIEPLTGAPIANNVLLSCESRRLNVNSNINKDVFSIQAIGHAAREGRVELCICDEIRFEFFQTPQKSSGNSVTSYYAFAGVDFVDIKHPINRYSFQQGGDITQGKKLDEFIDFLLRLSQNDIYKFSKIERFRGSLWEKLGEFQQLCTKDVFGNKSRRDAYFYWTAECAGLDYFLTVDYTLKNKFENACKHDKINTKCSIITPSELVEKLSFTLENIKLPNSRNALDYIG